MRTGETIRSFCLTDGRKAVLRTPQWEDLDDLLDMINSLVEEKADIVKSEKATRDQEIDWMSKLLTRLEKDSLLYLVAEIDGKVVAGCEFEIRQGGYDAHVSSVGIAIRDGFRDSGLGTEMMRTLIEQAKIMSLKVLTLSAFATNKRAIHVYEKIGFVRTGVIPKKFFRDDQYIDEVIMVLMLE